MDDDPKQCPYCAETIKQAAKICRYCHMDLATGRLVGATQAAAESAITSEVKAHSGVWDGVKIGFGIFVVLPVILFAGYVFISAFIVGASREQARHTPGVGSYTAPSSVKDYTPPSAEEIRTAEDVTAARNRGVSYAQEHSVKFPIQCALLTDPNERAGCEAVASWK